MGFVEATKKGFSNLFNFKGRARRSEYWWYVLTAAIVGLVVGLIFRFTYGTMTAQELIEHGVMMYQILFCVAFIILAFLLVSIQTRRMHDVNKNAFLPVCAFVCYIIAVVCYCSFTVAMIKEQSSSKDLFLNLTFIFASVNVLLQLIMLVYTLKDSQKTANRYGESPKYLE